MKISGFTFVRNAPKLFIPVKESIASILPLVDEFVIALGKGDADDTTEAEILALKSSKVRIIYTEWDSDKFPRNTIFAQQTDIAKEACTGDWLFYLQCDEALHEKYHPVLKKAFHKFMDDHEVEGLLFNYRHFWGDFEHYNPSHAFYSREIRVIRNLPQIHSWKDAQSFRYHEQAFTATFEGYQKKEGNRKLKVAQVNAEIYHYGWVRPPELMGQKRKISSSTYRGKEATEALFAKQEAVFDYGPLNKVARFKGTHPKVMQDWIQKINWKDQLQYSGKRRKKEKPAKHEKWKYRWLSWVENHWLKGMRIGEFKNFRRIR